MKIAVASAGVTGAAASPWRASSMSRCLKEVEIKTLLLALWFNHCFFVVFFLVSSLPHGQIKLVEPVIWPKSWYLLSQITKSF